MWDPTNNSQSNLLQKQRKFLKYLMYKCDGHYPIMDIELKVLLHVFYVTLKRRQIYAIKWVSLWVNWQLWVAWIYDLSFNTSKYSVRHPVTFCVPNCNSNVTSKSLIYRMINLFNKISDECDIFVTNLIVVKTPINSHLWQFSVY